jgi:hypothetical protein
MKLELLILGVTAFFIYNTYHEGKYLKLLLSYKKYYQMAFFGVLGFGVYLMLKQNPVQGRNMLVQANNLVKYMPVDKTALDMLSPIFDFTTNHLEEPNEPNFNERIKPNTMNGGRVNRSVSGMKKKYIASQQEWKCGHCKKQLDYTYEVDHKISLEDGGGNDVQNLIALCRECHGKKTVLSGF